MWQSQVENEHYSTVSGHGLIRLVISLECFIEITPDFVSILEPQLLAVFSYSCLNIYNSPYANVRFLPVTTTHVCIPQILLMPLIKISLHQRMLSKLLNVQDFKSGHVITS